MDATGQPLVEIDFLTLIDSLLTLVTMAKDSMQPDPSAEELWLRKVNQTWLVRSTLAKDASNYLDLLRAIDPERLEKTCRLVFAVMGEAPPDADPKPRFYGALFCLATESETQRFLSDHLYTRLTLPSCSLQDIAAANFDPPSLATLNEIRHQIETHLHDVE